MSPVRGKLGRGSPNDDDSQQAGSRRCSPLQTSYHGLYGGQRVETGVPKKGFCPRCRTPPTCTVMSRFAVAAYRLVVPLAAVRGHASKVHVPLRRGNVKPGSVTVRMCFFFNSIDAYSACSSTYSCTPSRKKRVPFCLKVTHRQTR